LNPSLQEIKQSYIIRDIAFYSYCNDPLELQIVAIEDSIKPLERSILTKKTLLKTKDHTCATCEIDLKG
jgi:hypothetical protein